MIRYALFDLDNTLYAPSSGVLPAIGVRIEHYLTERLGMSPAEAERLRNEYRDQYGTTLGGLRAHHIADAEDYLAYVHDVPIEELIRPNAPLERALASLPWECIVFTNSHRPHAERVLAALGIRRRFSRIFDIVGMGYQQKPDPKVYHHILTALGVEGEACLMADDALNNLTAAKEWEMTTVWVEPSAGPSDGVDYYIAEITAITEVAAQIDGRHYHPLHGGQT